MGDGKVALILDVLGLAQKSGVVSGVRERDLTEKAATTEKAADKQTVPQFSTPGGGRMAVPLAQVARLEEFPRSMIAKVGGSEVVQYRGEILPLPRVSKALRQANANGRPRNGKPRRPAATACSLNEPVPVIVHSGRGRRVGLVVGQIIDIVEEAIVARSQSPRVGVKFTAVVQARVTEFLDLEGLIQTTGAAVAGLAVTAGG